MNVLVTDGNNRATLAITRSLGKNGHRVFVGESSHPSLSSSSKHCFGRCTYADPAKDSDAFIRDILGLVERNGIDLLIPVTDITTALVAGNMDRFSKRCRIPLPALDVIRASSDKSRLLAIAEDLGVPVPRTIVLERRNEVDPVKVSEEIGFPVVVKPHRSRIPFRNGWKSTSVKYAKDAEDLKACLFKKDEHEFPLLLQERIQGPGIGVFACHWDGRILGIFSHKRIREKPPSGGVSVLRESIPVPPLAAKYTEMLLRFLDWQGVAMIEFKQDDRDGAFKLMEINGRFWGSLQLAIDSGVDFPRILLDVADDQEVSPILSYRTGVQTRWLWGDIDVLLMVLFKKREELDLPSDYPGRMRSIIEFLRFRSGRNFEVESMRDIGPMLFETSRRLRRDR